MTKPGITFAVPRIERIHGEEEGQGVSRFKKGLTVPRQPAVAGVLTLYITDSKDKRDVHPDATQEVEEGHSANKAWSRFEAADSLKHPFRDTQDMKRLCLVERWKERWIEPRL